MNAKLSPRKKFWLDHIIKQKKSALGQSEYCKKHGLNVKSFSAQKTMISKMVPNDLEPQDLFIPIKKTDESSSFSIKLPSGIELKFDKLPSPVWIAQIIAVMDEVHVKS